MGAAFGAVLVATLVTYARLPAADLYHVSREGLGGGASRALVELNFPIAIVAVPVALIVADVLGERPWDSIAAVAVAACLVTALPGVVDPDDLDATALNVIPALGVVLTVALVAKAWPLLGRATPRLGGDPLRVVLAVAILVAIVPWAFAELGFYAPDPLMADEPTPGEPIAAVHLGSHEGMDGALLALGALALSRLTPALARPRLRAAVSVILALLLAYGIANVVQDDWHEQVVKRGWIDAKLESFVQPQLTVRWAVVVAAGIAIEWLWFRRERPGRHEAGSTALTTS